MELYIKEDKNTLFVDIVGRIDTLTAPQLHEGVEEHLTEKINRMILNFEKVDYISSSGLRELITFQQ